MEYSEYRVVELRRFDKGIEALFPDGKSRRFHESLLAVMQRYEADGFRFGLELNGGIYMERPRMTEQGAASTNQEAGGVRRFLCWLGFHHVKVWTKYNPLGVRRVWCDCTKSRLQISGIGIGRWEQQ